MSTDGDWDYRVTYFPLYGRGEFVRTALVLAGVENWENHLMPFD